MSNRYSISHKPEGSRESGLIAISQNLDELHFRFPGPTDNHRKSSILYSQSVDQLLF